MSSLSEIQIAIQHARQQLQAAIEPEALRAGADAAALVENRIVTKGEKSEGGKLSAYSDKPVPAFYFFGRSRNNAGEQAVRRKAKKRESVSYKEFRELNGLNTANKNLEFTGEMWQGFGVTGARMIRPGVVEVTIGGKNSRTTALLGYHSERENTEISAPSRQEFLQIEAGISERLKRIIDNI